MNQINPATLPSAVSISDELNQKFIDIGDRRVASSKVLEDAMQALFDQHVKFEMKLAEESKALWEEAFASTGIERDDSYSIDTKAKVMFKTTDMDAEVMKETSATIRGLAEQLGAALGASLAGGEGRSGNGSGVPEPSPDAPNPGVPANSAGEKVQTMMDQRFDSEAKN